MITLVLTQSRLQAAIKTAADFYGVPPESLMKPNNRSQSAQPIRAARGAAIVGLTTICDAKSIARQFNLQTSTVHSKKHERGVLPEDEVLIPAIRLAVETGKAQKVSVPKPALDASRPRYFAPPLLPKDSQGYRIPKPHRPETEAQRVKRVLEAQQKWLPELRRLEADYLNGVFREAKT